MASPSELKPGTTTTFDFEFKNVEKQYECYNGINVRLRYYVCLRISRSKLAADIIRERDIWVYSYKMPIEINHSIKMEVGIEDCLHIEFEYNKSKYVSCSFILSTFFAMCFNFFSGTTCAM